MSPTLISCGRPTAASAMECCSSISSIGATRAGSPCSRPTYRRTLSITTISPPPATASCSARATPWCGSAGSRTWRQGRAPHHEGAGREKCRRLPHHWHRAQRTHNPSPHHSRDADHNAQPVERLVHRDDHHCLSNGEHRQPHADGFLPELTVRAHEHEPRVKIPNTEWSFGACGHT